MLPQSTLLSGGYCLERDKHYMRYALSLAARGLGRCAPNPSVGCVLVDANGYVVGAGRTADGGRPHAERIALNMAGVKARGATAYVTLEPCSHHGKTPPCAQALIEAGITRVVVSCPDPNPLVSGRGLDMLKRAGMEVVCGVLEKEASLINRGFFLTQTHKRPFITLKTAMSLDGKTALPDGASQWITNGIARRKVHQLRSQHDAIMVGINTVTHDDPILTTRLNGVKHQSIRIVLDSDLRISCKSKLVRSAHDEPLWIVHASQDMDRIESLKAEGVEVFYCKTMALKDIAEILSERGVTRLMVEGGTALHCSFIAQGLYDQLIVFRAPKILGKGLDAFTHLPLPDVLDAALQITPLETIVLGDNHMEVYVPEDLI